MTDTTTIIRLCRERAALYGAVRGSSLTAVALDRAADALEDALGIKRPPAVAGAASGEGQLSTLSNPSTFGRLTFGFEHATPAADEVAPPPSQDAAVDRIMDLVEERLCIHWYPASNRDEFAKLVAAAIAPQLETDRRDSTS